MPKQRHDEGKKIPVYIKLDQETYDALRWKAYDKDTSQVAIISELLIPTVEEWREFNRLRYV